MPLLIFACKLIIISYPIVSDKGETGKGVSVVGTGDGVITSGVALGKRVEVAEKLGGSEKAGVGVLLKYAINGGNANIAMMIIPTNVNIPKMISDRLLIRVTVMVGSSFRGFVLLVLRLSAFPLFFSVFCCTSHIALPTDYFIKPVI